MQQINKKDIIIPEWSFKRIDEDSYNKLKKSVKENGQVKSIVVRAIENGKYEVIDGKIIFKLLNELNIDYIWCKVYTDIDQLEAQLLYMQLDFHFDGDFVEVGKAVQLICKKINKTEISRLTNYTVAEVIELIKLNEFDFAKYEKKVNNQKNLM